MDTMKRLSNFENQWPSLDMIDARRGLTRATVRTSPSMSSTRSSSWKMPASAMR